MTDQNPDEGEQEPTAPPRTLRDEIADLRALRGTMRAAAAAQNRRQYPNASRGARIAGVPVSSLPKHLQSIDALREWEADDERA